jgi:hypothetical protein
MDRARPFEWLWPSRARTRNQTVMSAGLYREGLAKSAFPDQDHCARLVMGFLADNRREPPTGFDRTGPRFVRSGRDRGKRGLGEDKPFRQTLLKKSKIERLGKPREGPCSSIEEGSDYIGRAQPKELP